MSTAQDSPIHAPPWCSRSGGVFPFADRRAGMSGHGHAGFLITAGSHMDIQATRGNMEPRAVGMSVGVRQASRTKQPPTVERRWGALLDMGNWPLPHAMGDSTHELHRPGRLDQRSDVRGNDHVCSDPADRRAKLPATVSWRSEMVKSAEPLRC